MGGNDRVDRLPRILWWRRRQQRRATGCHDAQPHLDHIAEHSQHRREQWRCCLRDHGFWWQCGKPIVRRGGADAAAFVITGAGRVSFKTPPDFEQPGDSNRDNVYNITVTLGDTSGTATRDVAITVTNVADFTTVTQIGGTYTGADHIAPFPEQAPVPVPAKILVAERGGNVYIVDPATRERGTLYLTVTGIDTDPSHPGRRGLMSVAAANDFATSGILYAFVSTGNAIEVRRYGRTAAGLGDPASADVILRVPSSTTSRDIGGWLGGGADGLFFITTGRAGTNPTNDSLLGKVLRIDPTKDDFPNDPLRDYSIPSGNPFKFGGGAPEVYASGFNDPWRGAIDENDLYISDQTNLDAPATTPLYRITPSEVGGTFSNNGDPQTFPPVLRAGQTLTGAGFLVAGGIYRGQSPDLQRRFVYSVAAGFANTSYSGIYTVSNLPTGLTQSTRDCCTLFSNVLAVAFGGDVRRNLYFTDGSNLYMIQYR